MNRGAANFRIHEVRKSTTPLASGEFSNGAFGEITAGGYNIDPQAWLADVLARIANTPITRLDDLLPWNWAAQHEHLEAA